MKIKAPTFADLFAETSPQLGGARRTKFLETLGPHHSLAGLEIFDRPLLQ
ncbi:MAG: hypothetical protein ACLVAP_06455 [Parasutterella sp.]